MSKKIVSLFDLSAAAARFFTSLSVKRRSEAEELWKNAYLCTELGVQVEDFVILEAEWDAFLERLDTELQMSDMLLGQSAQAGSLSGEMALTDARSGESLNLAQYMGKDHLTELETNQGLLNAQSVRVLVVLFGSQEGAMYWLQDTGCKYDMLLDPQKKIYTAFGLGRSCAKVFRFNNMLEFAEYKVLNRDFSQTPPNLFGDIYQLGGDFVLDQGGKVIYSHPSQSPRDRPTVTEILAAIAEGSPPSES
ncbi:hypothetical protein AAFF_G00020690 [Aldrovandia affinis]|uniref:Uncharacterized protein n=1 Tax=Aldrovandia affinis TaxID=143900 RepID=A0AAD7S5N9_9TELE|nr:hypothetical protein AAFF_G00020690 [Aldrovandia affinis]